MKLISKEQDKVVFEEESYSRIKEFVVRDMRLPFVQDEYNWKLVRLEERSLGDNNIQYIMSAIFDVNGQYSEITMVVGSLSRTLAFDKEGRILRDYIVDSFFNSFDSDVFIGFGDIHDYSGENIGPNLREYLEGNQVFRNNKDQEDILDNRWLLNSFFLEFLAYDEYLALRTQRMGDNIFPQQLSLEAK